VLFFLNGGSDSSHNVVDPLSFLALDWSVSLFHGLDGSIFLVD
jgi:hypothetical protein